jgi:hypothetical protein
MSDFRCPTCSYRLEPETFNGITACVGCGHVCAACTKPLLRPGVGELAGKLKAGNGKVIARGEIRNFIDLNARKVYHYKCRPQGCDCMDCAIAGEPTH